MPLLWGRTLWLQIGIQIGTWHFWLLNQNLKHASTTLIPSVASVMRSYMNTRLVDTVILISTTGLVEKRPFLPGYRVTALYTNHPWDIMVGWVWETVSSIPLLIFGRLYIAMLILAVVVMCWKTRHVRDHLCTASTRNQTIAPVT